MSDGPHEPDRSRGSLLIAVNVVDVRARQQPNVVLSRDWLCVYDALSVAPNGSDAPRFDDLGVLASLAGVRQLEHATELRRRQRVRVERASLRVDRRAGTNTARFSSLLSVNAGVGAQIAIDVHVVVGRSRVEQRAGQHETIAEPTPVRRAGLPDARRPEVRIDEIDVRRRRRRAGRQTGIRRRVVAIGRVVGNRNRAAGQRDVGNAKTVVES